MLKNYVFSRPVDANALPIRSGASMQPMVDNLTPSDSMPNWQAASEAVDNGAGGAPGTHEGHANAVPNRDDLTPPGDDQTGYWAA